MNYGEISPMLAAKATEQMLERNDDLRHLLLVTPGKLTRWQRFKLWWRHPFLGVRYRLADALRALADWIEP